MLESSCWSSRHRRSSPSEISTKPAFPRSSSFGVSRNRRGGRGGRVIALRRSPAQEETIFERHHALRECLNAGAPTSEADFALHLAIAEATNNSRFREFLSMIGPRIIPRAAMREGELEADQNAYILLIDEEHHQIVVAISNGDEEGAREAMRRHLRGSQERYRALLREQRKPV